MFMTNVCQGLLNTTNATMHALPLPEYKTAAAKKPKWVFSHYGYFKNLWDVVILLATIYVAIIVPYNAAFHGTRYDQGRNNTIYCLGKKQNFLFAKLNSNFNYNVNWVEYCIIII